MSLLIKLLFLSGLILILLGWILNQSTKYKGFNNKYPVKDNSLLDSLPQHDARNYLNYNQFRDIDLHTRSLPDYVITSVDRLAMEIQRYAKTDLEKARALYVWITKNIRYDDKAYNSKQYPQYTPEYVLKHRTAVCEGYSILFEAVGKKLGLTVKRIDGHAKGYGHIVSGDINKSNHAWNVVSIGGRWKIIDSTWGSGYGNNVDGRLVSKQQFSEYWFDVNPFEAIFSHFPEIDSFQLVNPRIKKHEYQRLPLVNEHFFKLGFNARRILEHLISNPRTSLVDCHSFETPVRAISAPYNQILDINRPLEFRFHIPKITQMAVIDVNEQWSIYHPDGNGFFTISYIPTKRGKLTILYKSSADSQLYQPLLGYTVK